MLFEQFKFRNFEPSDEVRNLANRALNQILDLVPTGAHFGATLAKVGNAFEGLVEIVSSAGTIKEKTVDEDPQSLLNRLSSQIRAKITQWHLKRFSDFQLTLPFSKKN